MNVVHAGSTYQIYGESLKTYAQLPIRTYEVGFSKMTGFFLTGHSDLVVNEEKVYGSHEKKVDKILRSFADVDRNFGVILSGQKGVGKSLFARILSIRAREAGIPLIIVSEYVPGIANFLSSIEQEVIVLFDEFEKTFANFDNCAPQEEMLSLFDGIDGGKKLFIITCNEVNKLNSYLLNRPGRFHYHFIITNPNAEEIREYMLDKLQPQYHGAIDAIISFSMCAEVTYDVLRAIAFELNHGYSLEETLLDLNISKEGTPRYTIRIDFCDGESVETEERLDLYASNIYRYWFYSANSPAFRMDFKPMDVKMDIKSGKMYLDPAKVQRYVDEDDFEGDDAHDKMIAIKTRPIERITFTRVINNYAYKYLV